MTEFLFCITSMFFLAWVILLKLHIQKLNEAIAKLDAELQKRLETERNAADGAGNRRTRKEDAVWVR